MNELWCVVLADGSGVYGPMTAGEAEAFAKWLTANVDPAGPRKLRSPTGEVLAWWQAELNRNDCTGGRGCPVHQGLKTDHHVTFGPGQGSRG